MAAVEALQAAISRCKGEVTPKLFEEAIKEANEEVKKSKNCTTLTAALVKKDKALVVNIGDSVAFAYTNYGGLQQVTEIQRSGYGPDNVLGLPSFTPKININEVDLEDKALVLVTDGVNDRWGFRKISKILAKSDSPEKAAEMLVRKKTILDWLYGYRDSTTAVVVGSVGESIGKFINWGRRGARVVLAFLGIMMIRGCTRSFWEGIYLNYYANNIPEKGEQFLKLGTKFGHWRKTDNLLNKMSAEKVKSLVLTGLSSGDGNMRCNSLIVFRRHLFKNNPDILLDPDIKSSVKPEEIGEMITISSKYWNTALDVIDKMSIEDFKALVFAGLLSKDSDIRDRSVSLIERYYFNGNPKILSDPDIIIALKKVIIEGGDLGKDAQRVLNRTQHNR